MKKICPRTNKALRKNKFVKVIKWVCFPVTGLLALIWFCMRVIPKPSRAAYPCQQAAFPLASGFLLWIAGTIGIFTVFRKWKKKWKRTLQVILVIFIPLAFSFGIAVPVSLDTAAFKAAWVPPEAPNSPIGVARGINPGRVTWSYDQDVTSYNNSGNWWDDSNTDPVVVKQMLSGSIQQLKGVSTDVVVWDALFRYYNQTNGSGQNAGYRSGEKIAIKINLNQDKQTTTWNEHHMPTPQFCHALIDHLINIVGVSGSDITFYDASRYIGNPIVNKINDDPDPEFQQVKFVCGSANGNRVSPVADYNNPVTFSGGGIEDCLLPTCLTGAHYLINVALLRPHSLFGITACGKNHFGSTYFSSWTPSPLHGSRFALHGDYHCIVDLIGHNHIGGKTLLYIVDAIYSSSYQNDITIDRMQSFNNDWSSSIFTSQDPIAIDSVCLDFLAAESSYSVDGPSGQPDVYLHEAALADNPPSGTFYAPNNNGVRLASLGVHEHWNDANNKQYTRNLDPVNGTGIELSIVWSETGPTPDPGSLGDVDTSGTIDIVDALLIAQYYVGLNPPNFFAEYADVNCSESIDIVDALLIAQYYVGLIGSFSCS